MNESETDPPAAWLHPGDVAALAQLATSATLQLTDIVEAVHDSVLRPPFLPSRGARGRTRGITGFVYGCVRGVTSVVGQGLNLALPPLLQHLPHSPSTPQRDAAVSVLNGVLGDHLAATANPLATPMSFCLEGRPLPLRREELRARLPRARERLVVMVHGLCMNDRHWNWNGHDHGVAIAGALDCSVLYLRYNSGRHISENGRELAQLLEALVALWPCPLREIDLVGHSMGGLLSRSACHYAQGRSMVWRGLLRHLICLGTPHLGAPLERGGHGLHSVLAALPYAAPLARLGRLRSAGITDLREGNVRDEDWQGYDRFSDGLGPPELTPLPDDVACYALAATTARRIEGESSVRFGDCVIGDGLVPVNSALGRHPDRRRALRFAPEHRVVIDRTNHTDLLGSARVCEQLLRCLRSAAATCRFRNTSSRGGFKATPAPPPESRR